MAQPESSDRILAAFSELEWQRAELARTAAEYIYEEGDGRTTNFKLFTLAALGDRLSSNTPGAEFLRNLGRMVNSDAQGQPICIWTPDPDGRSDRAHFGTVGSFSEEAFEPVRFNMKPTYPRERTKFDGWDSWVQVAVHDVTGNKDDKYLSEQVNGIDVMSGSTVFSKTSDKTRLSPFSAGGNQAAFISTGAKAINPETSSPNPFGGEYARAWLAEELGDTAIEGHELKPTGTFGYC